MAITSNLKGTSYPSFTIGKQGVAVLQGTVDPLVGQGVNGDLYLQAGATPALWQKVAGAWNKIGNFGSKIFTGTTSVDTAEVADTITVNISAKRIIDILNDAASINGERLTIKNGNAGITLSTSDTSTTNAVDFVVDVQGTGAFKVQSDAESAIRTSDGSTITIQPGDKTDGAGGNVVIQGGTTTASGQVGGNIVLTPGASGSGAALAQVLVPSGYIASTEASVVNRLSVTNLLVVIVTAASHSVAGNEQAIIVTRTSATTVTLPSTNIPVGHQVKVKQAGAGATTTVNVTGGGNIDAGTSFAINAWEKATFIWSGTQWYSI